METLIYFQDKPWETTYLLIHCSSIQHTAIALRQLKETKRMTEGEERRVLQ